MDLIDIIGQGQGGEGFAELAQRFGLSDDQARAAVEQLAPAVMAGIRRNSQTAGGVSDLVQALATGDHQRYLDGSDAGIADDGNAILGHVFGSKEVSRGVAANAAQLSGVGAGILKQMLPVVAAMVMGALARKITGTGRGQAGGGGLGDMLGQVFGGGAAAGGLGDILGGMLGGQSAGGAARPATPGNVGDVLGQIFGQGAAPQVQREATKRAEQTLNQNLGAGTPSGKDADDLLASITRSLSQS
jgi:hypothetical protein